MSNTFKTISTCCDDKNSKEEHYLCCVDEVGDSVKRIVRNFQLFERDQVKTLGFTMSQCYTLIEMLENEAMTMHELSEKMNLNSSTMTRVVDKLVRDKYVERTRSPEDRRIVLVSLTQEKGREAAQMCSEKIGAYYENITRNLPKDRIEEVLESVSLLMDAFEKANPNCC
ncbi:MarR family winged helix-turn-helix transcriptional regulator [Fusibacter sp. JL216-2]|uniref:MarR family winged helix-turn-helix transcriptional regulator n=1 Tax=Fusibacter sp. JL216-2 TaxID=3071453 RepID=UPI003D338093